MPLPADPMEGLNQQQYKAATYDGRNLLVLAGAGTGKTRTIIARAKHLVDTGVEPGRIVILSFTRKSAKEIVGRLQAATNRDTRELAGRTFHSWCIDMIEQHPSVFNFGKFTILDEEDRDSAFRLIGGRTFKRNNFITADKLAGVYSYAVNTRCNLSTALQASLFNNRTDDNTRSKIMDRLPVFKEVIQKYIAYKAERHYLDYDDVLQKVAVGLMRNPQAAEFVAGRYDHILIDEMQDTNPLQYLLLQSFWNRCNLFCVGDDAQSIYGFRGADFQSIHRFTELVPDASVMRLTLNYRSTQELLDLSNWLLDCSPLVYNKQLEAARGAGEMPEICHFRNEWDQARDITMRIKNSTGEEGCKYKDNMVLSRNNYGLRVLEACLMEAQIPYVIFGGSSLTASAHVRDVMSALRVVANPHDELAWERYLRLWPGIGEITAAKLIDPLIALDDLNQCLVALETNHSLHPGIVATLEAISEVEARVGDAVKAALNGLETVLKHKFKDEWDKRRLDFRLMERLGEAFDSITAFITEYALDPAAGTADKLEGAPEDAVVLSTIHSSKGLEAKNCYIINANYNRFPSSEAILAGQDAIEEDRRCLYVAMTRAADRLVIYRTVTATTVIEAKDTEELDFTRSYFLNNVPQKLFTLTALRGATAAQFREYKGAGLTLDQCDEFDFN